MQNMERRPVHPGEVLREEFLTPLNISQTKIASEIGTTFRTINEIVNEKRNVSPEMAIKLSLYLGTSIDLWLNLQNQYDIYNAYKKNKINIGKIKHFKKSRIT